MYRRCNCTVSVGRIFTLFLSLSLVFSFGLHSIQIAHAHFGVEHGHEQDPGAGGLQLSEYMHLADKKIFALGLIIFLAPWTFLDSYALSCRKLFLYVEMQLLFRIRILYRRWNVTFEYLRISFRKGVLHPKVF